MRLIEAFVQNPVKVSVGVLLVVLFGVIALLRMPMQLTPEVEIPKISIGTRWPGAAPQDVEREIIQEQEEQLQGVEGVTKMSAECQDSMGTITLEFAVGTDLSEALLKVNSRLQQVPEYPEDADEPVISTSDPRANAIAWFILRPRVATSEEIRAFAGQNPDLAPLLEPVAKSRTAGLRTRRILNLVEEHPEIEARIAGLLPPDVEVPELQRFAEDFIEARFERVEGCSNSTVYGGREDEMQVIVDPELLAARRVTIFQVRQALRGENRDVSGGDLQEGKRRYVIRTLGRFERPEQVESVIIGRGDDGSPVYVRDVAEVRLGFKKPTAVVKNFGTTCLALNCNRDTGANVLKVMDGLREVTATLNRDVLRRRGLELIQVYDETDYINSAIGLVNQNIVVGGLLTIAVLLLFLRSGRSTIVIALAIPTSIIGTFLMLNLFGRSLNVISLAGLAFAVGMLVDNAVVVLENCYRHAQKGDNAFVAAVRGGKEVWGAVVASTLTTLAVFLPVLFVQEEAGQLFRDIALAISSAVGLSLIVSITVIPTAAARLLRPGRNRGASGDDDEPDRWEDGYDRHAEDSPADRGKPRRRGPLSALLASLLAPLARLADWLGRRFVEHVVALNRFLQRSVALRLATVLGFVGAAVGVSYLMMPQVEYLPAGNRNLAIGILLPPPGYNIDQTLDLGNQIEAGTKPYWDVDPDDPATKSLDYPAIDDYFFVASNRRVFFGVRSMDPHRVGKLVELMKNQARQIPGAMAQVFQRNLFSSELGGGRTIDIEITGPSLERLVDLGLEIFMEVPRVVDQATGFPRPSLDLSNPEIHVVRRLNQAADMGVTTSELGYAVDALIDGAYATDYYVGGDKIDLSILGNEEFAKRTQHVKGLPIATPTGDLVRLEGLADVRLGGGPEQINRRERQRAITITVTPPRQIPLEKAIDDINREIVRPRLESGALGEEYQVSLAGTADKLLATWNALRWNFVLALLVTYLLMAALFESWLYPFVIILSVPLGAVGGFLGLWAINLYLGFLPEGAVQTLDVLTMLGFVILIGTVVNNPILIVHQSLNHIRDEGMHPREAILESVRTRIRPIFMTTLTTVLGLAPLVLFPGAGSELYRGLGAVVLGGLLVSTLFTLILVPTLFSLMMDAKAALVRWLGREEAETVPLAAEADRKVAVAG
ncbi:MAG: efflux RND transporter permease subunit [Planctomycetota bacterium]|jgi:HAE1 family hydrophobic/amphiphilic exporter-1